MIALIDYDAGNLLSVYKALAHLGEKALITGDHTQILNADKVILPGVGAYLDCMNRLREYGLTDVLKEVVKRQTPLLGICLGMQLLFEDSSEGACGNITNEIYRNGMVRGLSLLRGNVRKLESGKNLKIPHMGWNSIHINGERKLFRDIDSGSYVYFVHSYQCIPKDTDITATITDYGMAFVSSVEYGNVFGCQFHPEKSSDVGLKILSNFIGI